LWFRGEGIKLPKRIGKAGVEFVEATPWLIGRILKDPVYAGAYAFGRTNQKVILEEGRKRVIKERHAAPEDWQVLIQDHHEAYLSWSEYQSNLETLRHNRNQLGTTVRGAARDGKGLLAGLARCGVCGKKMRVRYGGRSGRWSAAVYYQCAASQHAAIGKQLCSQFGGVTVEQAVVEAVLAALAPVRIEALAQASDQLEKVGSERRRQLELEIERARFEADRCRRQYDAVEPENRLVVRNLEQRWNEALTHVDRLQEALSELEPSPAALSGQEQEALAQLASDLPRLWQHEAAPFDLKKRIVRAVIKEIVVTVEATMLRVLIHWHGGQHSALDLRKRRNGEHRWKTSDTTLDLITQLARLMSDKQIAAQLNRMGVKSAKGHNWTRVRVGNFRKDNAIANYTPGERQARGELTIEAVAERLAVSYSTVQRMIRRKQLPARQVCPGAPWIIEARDVDALCLASKHEHKPDNGPSSPASDQKTLAFSENI
jgi:excisionase family DNA binding protein